MCSNWGRQVTVISRLNLAWTQTRSGLFSCWWMVCLDLDLNLDLSLIGLRPRMLGNCSSGRCWWAERQTPNQVPEYNVNVISIPYTRVSQNARDSVRLNRGNRQAKASSQWGFLFLSKTNRSQFTIYCFLVLWKQTPVFAESASWAMIYGWQARCHFFQRLWASRVSLVLALLVIIMSD